MPDSTRVHVARGALNKRLAAHGAIQYGRLPTVDELLVGSPFFKNDWTLDLQTWAGTWLDVPSRRSRLGQHAKLLEVLRDTLDVAALQACHALPSVFGGDAARLAVYVATCRDAAHDSARILLARDLMCRGGVFSRAYHRHFETAVAIGLMRGFCDSMEHYYDAGIADIRMLSISQAELDAAENAEVEFEEQDLEEAKRLVGLVADDEPVAPPGPRLVVVPKLPEAYGSRKEIYKSWSGVAGTALPLIQRGDVAAHRAVLVSQLPHASDVIDTILADLSATEAIRIRPTLLVGAPGAGKSSLAGAIANQIGLPKQLIALGGAADSSLMGTSAQWTSARESIPLQLIKSARVANPMLIWDEVDKASPGRHNGSALDALLGLLEVDQAREFRDPALEVPVDLSAVSHIATANDLDAVPAPLRDRMRVLVVPEPGWQHVGVLARQIMSKLARDRGLDERWMQPLTADELELIRQAWPGGSIRRLTRIVTVIVDGRQIIMGRC